MENLKKIAEDIRAELDAKNAAREQALTLSREIIRLSANSIRAVHRDEFDDARELMDQAQAKVIESKKLLQNQLDIYYTGYVLDAQKEYAESELTMAIVRNMPLPSHQELGVECAPYLNGLGEAIGECRRRVLDIIRLGEFERGEQILQVMDDVYYLLVTFDYPDAVTGGLRRTTDMVRGVLERTRGDLTVTISQKELEDSIKDAVKKLATD
ncbi:MAG TPA: haloacid dehalogenase [Armatimonadota bacterium]|nr:haloacid dehalogenase [Armatimonadota bacterium]HPP76407.1 haloacid dehalogenase [Armatimonadota bacterium]